MKDIVEFKDYRTRLAYDRERGKFTQITELHPFTRRQAAPAARDVDDRPPPPAEPFVAFAWMRMPDARACLPTGARLPRRAKHQIEARHGHRVLVRCRLPDIDSDEGGAVIIE